MKVKVASVINHTLHFDWSKKKLLAPYVEGVERMNLFLLLAQQRRTAGVEEVPCHCQLLTLVQGEELETSDDLVSP